MVASEDQIVSIIKERITIIDRSEYIKQLLAKRWNGKVKIVTGIKRSAHLNVVVSFGVRGKTLCLG